jgi:hypothetical protein
MRQSLMAAIPIVLFAAPAWAKPKIAILGLEPFDAGARPVAKDLTEALRDRVKIAAGPYVLAPGSAVDLAAEKKANDCASEASPCMAAIGANSAPTC